MKMTKCRTFVEHLTQIKHFSFYFSFFVIPNRRFLCHCVREQARARTHDYISTSDSIDDDKKCCLFNLLPPNDHKQPYKILFVGAFGLRQTCRWRRRKRPNAQRTKLISSTVRLFVTIALFTQPKCLYQIGSGSNQKENRRCTMMAMTVRTWLLVFFEISFVLFCVFLLFAFFLFFWLLLHIYTVHMWVCVCVRIHANTANAPRCYENGISNFSSSASSSFRITLSGIFAIVEQHLSRHLFVHRQRSTVSIHKQYKIVRRRPMVIVLGQVVTRN